MTDPVPHQALYRRWRAQTFAQIVGQDAVVQTLRNAVRTDRVSHAVLFVGPRGTGKTSLARILAKALNCTDLQDGDACDRCPSCVSIRDGVTLDVVEIDAASNRGIDAVRDLRERLAYPPGQLRRKVYILDEAHQVTRDAWNALLKSIEEPPPFVNFMFASTEPSGFPPAVRSRLQRYDVRRLTTTEIEGKLERILEADGREADPAALALIARLAAGGMRDAESMLDQLLSAAPERITEADVRELLGLADAEAVETFVDALIAGDGASGIALLERLDERGRDPRTLLDQAVELLRERLLAALANHSDDVAVITAAARRLAAIDPGRAGIGGLRLQLELALLTPIDSSVISRAIQPTDAVPHTKRPTPEPRESAKPAARVEPAAPVELATSAAPEMSAAPVEPADPAAPAAASQTAARQTIEPAPAEASEPVATAVPEAVDQPVTTPATPDTTTSALDTLLAAWPEIVARLSENPPTKPLITKCRPVAVDGAIVTLGFPEEQAFLKDAAERRKSIIESGIGSVLGHDVSVRCVVANVELVETAPPTADASFVLAEARRIFADDLIDVGEIE